MDTQEQKVENDSIDVKPVNTNQSDADTKSGKKSIQTKAIVTASKTAKISFVFAILSLGTLLALAGLWVTEWRKHQESTRKQVKDIRTEITAVRSLFDASIKEDLICLKIHVLQRKINNETAREIASAVYKYARLYEREPDLVLAIMKVESNFAPAVESKMGAIGLMQIMPQWIDVLGIDCNLKNPDCNTRYGLQILGAYELLYDDLDMALTAYNRGPGPVDAALMRGKNPDNGYAGKVMAVYERLRELNR